MPKLPTYTAQVGEYPTFGGRRATAEDFGSSGALDAGHAIQSAASARMEQIEAEDARTALIANARIRAATAQELDAAVSSGAPLEPIKQKMIDQLAKVGENFSTKAGQDALAKHMADSEIIFDQQANQIAVQRAVSKAQTDAQSYMVEQGRIIGRNPEYLGVAIQNAEAFGATLPANTPAHIREKIMRDMKEDATIAAANASGLINPKKTIERLDAGEWDLTPKARESVRDNVMRYESVKREAESREKARLDAEKRERQEKAQLKYVTRIFSGDVSKRLYEDIVRDPDLGSRGVEHMIGLIKQHRKDLEGGRETARTTPSVFNDLRERIDLPPTDGRRVRNIEEVWGLYGKGLSKEDASFLEKRLRDNRSEDGRKWSTAEAEVIRNLKGRLDKSTLNRIDDQGGTRVQAFTQFLRDKRDEYVRDKKDRYVLLNAKSKEYIGEYIPMFQTGAQKLQSEIAGKLGESLAPKNDVARRPGETPADYLKRRGLK